MQLRVPDRASLHAALRDVSEGGLYVETASPPHVGEQARVELFPPGWPQPLILGGTVVRAELTGYALRLDSLSDKARGQLKTLVAQVANDLSGPQVKSVTEAQQRLAEMEAELRDAKDKLAKVKEDAENNRAYLERALSQAGNQRQRGNSNFVLGLTGAACFVTGIVVATIATVARTEPPPAPHYAATPRPASPGSGVRSLDEAGPRRPSPLPMAAIFNSEGEMAHDGGAARDAGLAGATPGGHTVVKKPANPSPPPKPGSSGAPGADVGRLNFLASAPATVLLDNEKLGNTPMRGVALKPGSYKLQFQCSGGTPSEAKTLEVLPFSETDVEHRCQ